MKISKTGIVLALAALAPLCAARAGAQEAAWPAADQAGGAVAAMRAVQARAKKTPKPAAPTAPEQAWRRIVESIRTNGDYRPQKSMFVPARFGFKDVRGDAKGDHAVESAGIVGSMNEAELFNPEAGEFVSESWALGADGNWTVDRWMIATDLYGGVQDAAHKIIVKTAEMKEISSQDVELAPDAPSLAAKFKSVIEYWAARP